MLRIALLCAALLVSGSAQAQEESFLRFTSYITTAKQLLKIQYDWVVILDEKDVVGNGFASTEYKKISDVGAVYIVRVQTKFIAEAPDEVLEAVAMHEMCHVAHGDHERLQAYGDSISLRLRLEVSAESCAQNLLGGERYLHFLKVINDWRPHDPSLEAARKDAVAILPDPG